jgi:DNA-binding NarL/FixJ family response regulator
MINSGARGYVLKYAEPDELINAINSIAKSGFYYSDSINHKLVNSILTDTPKKPLDKNSLTEKEIVFLKYCCTDLAFKEIAEQMGLSPKTVDRYREILFEKLEIHSRVGLAMYAVKNGLV